MSVSITYNPGSRAVIRPLLPLSKSVSARVACLDYLAGAEVRMHSQPCEDERVIAAALRSISSGCVELAASGTARRLLTAIIAATPGAVVRVQGTQRLMERPMRPLTEALRELGAPAPQPIDATTEELRGARLSSPGPVIVDASVSSQFVSALLLIGPLIAGGLDLRLRGKRVSSDYVAMTVKLMRRYGASVTETDEGYRVAEGRYATVPHYISEPDWSSASYFLELGCLTGRAVELPLTAGSCQGDSVGPELFSSLQSAQRVDLDMSRVPDLVPAVAATCCALGKPFELRGVGHLRHKESDRLEALRRELAKMGAEMLIGEDSLISSGKSALTLPSEPLKVYDDHRLMMAFAPLSALFPGRSLLIDASATVVDKSFPSFWREMSNAGIIIKS